MRLVSYAVLGVAVSFCAVAAWATQSQAGGREAAVVQSDPDVAKLLAVVNQRGAESKGLKQVAVNIDGHGRTKDVSVSGCAAGESHALRARIRKVNFQVSPKLKAKKIRLIFGK